MDTDAYSCQATFEMASPNHLVNPELVANPDLLVIPDHLVNPELVANPDLLVIPDHLVNPELMAMDPRRNQRYPIDVEQVLNYYHPHVASEG